MFDDAVQRRVGDLNVRITGAGGPVLLIHGNSGDLHYFDRILPLLSGRRVVAMDCRGQGRSARGTGPLTIARMAEDAADVIRATASRNDHPFDVVGFSDGANVAMVLAARHPELVRGLVLNSGNVRVAGLTRGLRLQLHVADALTRWRIARRGPLARRHELIRLMLDEPGVTEHDLRTVTAPTLVVVGSRDVVRPAHSRRIAELMPAGRLRVVAGGTHFVLRDMPGVSGRLIADFLESVDDGRGDGDARDADPREAVSPGARDVVLPGVAGAVSRGVAGADASV